MTAKFCIKKPRTACVDKGILLGFTLSQCKLVLTVDKDVTFIEQLHIKMSLKV